MPHDHTTAAVQRFLVELADGAPTEPVVRALLERSVSRLEVLCGALLSRSYPRLARPPLNLNADELLSAVVERLIKALREIKPRNPREFFGLANRHIRWELNDLARRLDSQRKMRSLADDALAAPETDDDTLSPNALRMLTAIEELPDDERETFDLVRIQGLSHPETAELLNISTKTVQRRLNRAMILLDEKIHDLRPPPAQSIDRPHATTRP